MQSKGGCRYLVAVGVGLRGVALILLLVAAPKIMKQKKRSKCSNLVKEWIAQRTKGEAYAQLMSELRLTDKDVYRTYLRIDTNEFQVLLYILLKVLKIQVQLNFPICTILF